MFLPFFLCRLYLFSFLETLLYTMHACLKKLELRAVQPPPPIPTLNDTDTKTVFLQLHSSSDPII